MANQDHLPPDKVSVLDENYLQHWEVSVGPDMMPSFIADLLDTFEASSGAHIQKIADACASHQIKELIHELHYIKGSLGNIGLSRASAFARQAEVEIRTNQFDRISEFPANLSQYIDQGIIALRKRYA